MISSNTFYVEKTEKTRFLNKMGVYSNKDQTVTWTADNGVRIVSFLKGRTSPLTYRQYEKGDYLGQMIAIAKNNFESDGESVFSQTLLRGSWPFNRTFNWHIFFDPHLIPVVTSFTRYPQAENSTLEGEFDPALENDLSTPYNSVLSKQMGQKVGLFLSSFGLPPKSYAVIHKSISDYFNVYNGNYSDFAKLADSKFFKPWSDKNEFIDGHASFSSMTWATVSKFILGVPEAEFVDHAHVWNTLLQGTKGLPAQVFTKLWYFSDMEVYVLKKIRDTEAEFLKDPRHCIDSETQETIIHYWMRNNTADAVLANLTSSVKEQALNIAESRNITIKEMVYLDNFFGVMIGMQENIAFILTQIAYHFARDKLLAIRCKTNENDCKKMVREAIRFMPPAGISRELRFDSNVIDPINKKTYSANKGDQFITMPPLTMHLDMFSPQHNIFDIDRQRTQSYAFSEGPHKCPGQMPALDWLYALTYKLAQYEFNREGLEEPDYYVSFILRDSDMKFKMLQPKS